MSKATSKSSSTGRFSAKSIKDGSFATKRESGYGQVSVKKDVDRARLASKRAKEHIDRLSEIRF
jgi:hypothetical protein